MQEKAQQGFGKDLGKDAFGKELVERPRATAEEALNPKRYRGQALNKEEMRYVGEESGRNGAIAAFAAACISGSAVYLANIFSPKFRRGLGVSGKMALVVTPTAGAFFLRSHLTVADARSDPDAFIAPKEAHKAAAERAAAKAAPQTQLTFCQSACNLVYVHPFKVIGAIAIPSYFAVFYKESTHPATAGMMLSQRLIHTRVCTPRGACQPAHISPTPHHCTVRRTRTTSAHLIYEHAHVRIRACLCWLRTCSPRNRPHLPALACRRRPGDSGALYLRCHGVCEEHGRGGHVPHRERSTGAGELIRQ